ncbi:PIN domain-containing protein [Legionella pneumophila]|uniref:PIN domain-containing protein n=1 Tax=Legionella pneumophila TaxID=446 RepID=UPI0007770DD3|nr:PIN domain-containing protein [Legionella pneumophila]HAT8643592.1 hypothetical protein [Legionella pneumophila]
MNLFIDTNIFLSFFHFTNDDLEEIRKLEVLIDKKEVVLWLPEQVKNEFYRNRENKLFDTIKKIKELNINLQFPQIFKDYPEYQQIKQSIKDYKSIFSRLDQNVRNDIENKSLKADQIIKELFGKATTIETSPGILESAQQRVVKGNPPGKNGSFGDSINWECLLSKIPLAEDIYLVSEDGDFYSILDENKIKDFLCIEWETHQQSRIFLYRRLSQFFKEHYPNIKLATELERELSVKKLINSTSFSMTHSAIYQLTKYTEFNPSQLDEMILAGLDNNQIRWILDDSDVFAFYEKLIIENEESIEEQLYSEMVSVLESINSQ